MLFHTTVAELYRQKGLRSLRNYKPPAKVLKAWPDPDPREFGRAFGGYNDSLHEYLKLHDITTIYELSWAERFLLAHGILPDAIAETSPIFNAISKLFQSEVALSLFLLAKEEGYRRLRPRSIRVVEGVRLGRIASIKDIKQSKNHQRLAMVDVGEAELRQIVCAGENVLRPGHKVLVALPGAKYIRLGDNGAEKKGVIRARKYNSLGGIVSQGVLLSAAEARPSFLDMRPKVYSQVCILSNNTRYKPGTLLDNKILTAENAFWDLK